MKISVDLSELQLILRSSIHIHFFLLSCLTLVDHNISVMDLICRYSALQWNETMTKVQMWPTTEEISPVFSRAVVDNLQPLLAHYDKWGISSQNIKQSSQETRFFKVFQTLWITEMSIWAYSHEHALKILGWWVLMGDSAYLQVVSCHSRQVKS